MKKIRLNIGRWLVMFVATVSILTSVVLINMPIVNADDEAGCSATCSNGTTKRCSTTGAGQTCTSEDGRGCKVTNILGQCVDVKTCPEDEVPYCSGGSS